MTDIDVPDWVVTEAVEVFLSNTGQAHKVTDLQRELSRECMVPALRAALSAWVVPQHQCMCTDEDEVPNGPRDIWMDVSAEDYPKLTARNDVRGRTLYILAKEKP